MSDFSDFSCLVKDCRLKFNNLFLYSRHLVSYHDLPINVMYIKFKKMVDFEKWKTNEEITNNCMFYKTRSEGFFRCHRNSYIMKAVNEDNLIHKQDEDERHYKIKAPCPAHIKFEKKNGELHVMYVRTHYGYCQVLRNHAISTEISELVKKIVRENKVQPGSDSFESRIVKTIRSGMKDKDSTDYLITTRHVIDILKEANDTKFQV